MLPLVLSIVLVSQVVVADPDLMALETEMAQLQAQRGALGGYHNNAKRDEVDRQLAQLRRVYDRAMQISSRRVNRCISRPTTTAQGQPQLQMVCTSQGAGVVSQVRRAEEIRDRIRYGNWNYRNFDEKQALQKELTALDALLGD